MHSSVGPCKMTWELLDIATKYTMGEEAILANFSGKGKTATYHSRGDSDDEANMGSRCYDKKKDKKDRGEEMVAATEHATWPKPKGKHQHPKHFERVLEEPCQFHGGQARHLHKDCITMQSYIRGTLNLKSKA